MSTRKVYFSRFFTICAIAALAGCATAPAVKDESSDVIKQRSVERWNFLIAHHADKAYDYLSPGFRATQPRDEYAKEMNGRGMRWSKVSFGAQECQEDSCTVHLVVDYKLNMGGLTGEVSSTGPVTETWIKSGGKWYFLPDAMQSPKLQQSGNP